jgi:D-lyxose ketol-isomerase
MKRSEINQAIRDAMAFFQERKFELPGWAFWSPEDWKGKGDTVAEIANCGLGWDITDFGSGDFQNIGLINFNLRNGIVNETRKNYCEKIIIVLENQVTPLHTHRLKIEDIINRGGGNLVIVLQNSDADLKLNNEPVTVSIDGILRTVPAKGKVILQPGESIFLEPRVYHEFYGEAGKGKVLVGEVSSVNDDNTDNVFVGGNPRFPNIEEDEAPAHLLVNDYQAYL